MSINLDAATKDELIAYVYIRYRKEINPREPVETIRHRVKSIEITRQIIKKIGMKPW